jgi:hypothetical protein
MLRPAANVLDTEPRQRFLEFGLAAPNRVLPAVVSQDFGRRTVRGDAALEGLHHERRLLVMCERVTDDEAAVVVHEHADVEPLCAPQPKREDVRLPELIRHGPLETTRRVLARGLLDRRLDQPFFVQNAAHLLLRDTECLEAREHVPNPACAPLLVLTLEPDYLFPDWRCLERPQSRFAHLGALGRERRGAVSTKRGCPLRHRCHRNAERPRHVLLRCPLHPFLDHQQLVRCSDLPTARSVFLLSAHLVPRSADLASAILGRRC